MTTTAVLAARPRSEFKPLVEQIRAAGLMERHPGYYLGYAVALGAATVLAALVLTQVSGLVAVLVVAPFAALLSSQVGFLGHDAGHQQISDSHRVNRWIGLVAGDLCGGLSYGWWQDKHLRHHANPNHEGLDPDVGEGVISWSERQQAKKTGFSRWFGRHQAALFFPLLTLEGWNLKYNSFRTLKERPRTERRLEVALLVVHYAVYAGFLAWALGPLVAVVFVLVHQAFYGLILGAAFAPNHKGMAMPDRSDRLDHLRKQVLTSRDVTGGPWVDFLLGGLNHQVTHHLFPSMARPHLTRARPIIRDYCAEIGLEYRSCGVVQSYAECLSYLHRVGSDPA